MEECLFCKIVSKEIPCESAYEDKEFVAFQDIHPKAPIHLLIVPKQHIESVSHLKEEDTELMGKLMRTAQKVAGQLNLEGYKLQMNVGRKGGQEVDHIHLHLLADISHL